MALLRRFHLDQYAQMNPYTLSGGEKRRLTVAAALAAAPRVLILDEPTFGQDRRTWMQIVRLIHSLRSDGVSIIVVTHDRELVTALGAPGDALAALAPDVQHPWPGAWPSRPLASRSSYVFQNPDHQFACSSVLGEVMLGPTRSGVDESTARVRGMELLRRFHLDQYARMNPYTLSGGEKRRLSGGEKRRLTVAAALAAAPRVLILDEPTFGQDRRTWMQIVRLIHSLRSDGVSIIVVTHDRELVTALGARVVELVPHDAHGEWVADPQSAHEPDLHAAAAAHATDIEVSAVNDREDTIKPASRSPLLASINPVYRLGGRLARASSNSCRTTHTVNGLRIHSPRMSRTCMPRPPRTPPTSRSARSTIAKTRSNRRAGRPCSPRSTPSTGWAARSWPRCHCC